MASWAALLPAVLVVVSVLLPLKTGNTHPPHAQSGATPTPTTDLQEGARDEAEAPSLRAAVSAGKGFQQDATYRLLLDLFPQDPPKRQYRRKADDSKVSVPSLKAMGDSKLLSEYDPLLKFMFDQKYKVKTNVSTTGKHTKPDGSHGGVSTGGVASGHKERMDNILKILAIFGEHFDTGEEEGSTARKEVITVTTTTRRPPGLRAEDMSCIHVEGYDRHQWIRIVNLCARDWSNKTVLYLCQNAIINDYVMTDTPVQDRHGTVYANRFCAFCNHVTLPHIRKWQNAWTCGRNDNPATSLFHPAPFADLMAVVTSLRQGSTCQMTRTPPVPSSIQACPTPVLRGSQHMPVVNAGKHVPPGSGYPVSLNILMNFDFSGKTHIMFEDLYAEESIETKLCPQENFVWDGEMGRCREVVCAKGFHFDDTYTTCLQDDNTVIGNEEEMITDLSQLAQSNDIERVTLEVEVPSGFAALVTITSNEFWVEQIAMQLNITTTRIQKFNVTVENATGEASTLLIQKLSQGDLPAPEGESEDHDTDPGPSHGEVVWLNVGNVPTEQDNQDTYGSMENPDSGYSTARSDEEGPYHDMFASNESLTLRTGTGEERNKNDFPKTPKSRNKREPRTWGSTDHQTSGGTEEDVPDEGQPVSVDIQNDESPDSQVSASSELDPPPDLTLLEDPDNPCNFKIIMSFILLPPESFRSGEKRSGNVVEALSSLVSSSEFKFIINGTSLKVENMAQEDTVGVFSPACPHGVLLVLDGEQIELTASGDSPLGTNITMLKDLRTGKTYVQGMFDVSFIVTQPIGNTTEKAQSYVYNALACEMPWITNSDCTRIFITAEEYSLEPITKTLTFQNSSFDISSYEYINDNYDEVEICVPESLKEAMSLHPSRLQYIYYSQNCVTDYQGWLKAEGYLTAVLGRLSIVALFAVLLTYCLFPSLRNLPGVNTLNLTFALFLAEVVFAAGEEVQIPWLCTAVAASLHYCFLSSHCWMNVMSYDVYRTFAASTCILTRVRDKRKMFPRYALYAWGMPLLVLGTCLFIDLTGVFPGIRIGYGGTWSAAASGGGVLNDTSGLGNWTSGDGESRHPTVTTTTSSTERVNSDVDNTAAAAAASGGGEVVRNGTESGGFSVVVDRSFSCWIQEPLAALYAFGAPLLLIFLMNCVFFARTIASIRRTGRLARHSGAGRTNSSNSARQLSGHNDVILYVKMSSVMGFTWVFGLASSVISSVAQEPSDVICYVLHVLGVIFPILNSSQGLFIFFAFVFNRRVLGLYRVLGGKVKSSLARQKKALVSSGRGKPMTNIATISRK
ncbi:uncharacterized protein LOC143287437 isoform X2 [Babylonia areolata]|uniref:uncharacterized protein LOC143287437 isoform X2 n=1 Tax=Babylonia areolata TaxID=304850 RepID=UPI003FD46CFF